MTKSITRVNAIEVAMELVKASEVEDRDDVIEVLEKIKTSFSKKSNSKADKAKSEEAEKIQKAILDTIGTGRMRLVGITKGVNEILGTEYSTNKVSANLTKLKDSGLVIREEEKKIAYFTVA